MYSSIKSLIRIWYMYATERLKTKPVDERESPREAWPEWENSILGFLKLFICGNERCHTTYAP